MDEFWGDFGSTIVRLEREDDFGCAVLGCAFIEASQKHVLSKVLVSGKATKSLLFAIPAVNAAKILYAIGLTSSEMVAECEILFKVRNAFAHSHQTNSFKHPIVEKHIASLPVTSRLPGDKTHFGRLDPESANRKRFECSVFTMLLNLESISCRATQLVRVTYPEIL